MRSRSSATARFVRLPAMVALATCFSACGDSSTAPPPAVTVSITASSTDIDAGATVALTASVLNSSNTGVRWQTTGGALSPSGLTATFTAPFTGGSYTIKATSLADTTRQASVTINVRTVTITVTPATITLGASAVQTFTATVTNSVNTGLQWSATAGTITGTGSTISYAAPIRGGIYTLTATSVADSTRRASSSITVTPVTLRLSADSAVLVRGERLVLTADVTGTPFTDVTWTGTCVPVSTAGNTVTYSPLFAGACQITARSVTDTSVSTTSSVRVRPVFRTTHFDDTDDGSCNTTHCSLREAIAAANAANDVDSVLISSVTPVTITLSSALPSITSPMHVAGTSSSRITIDAAASLVAQRRVLDVNGTVTGSISGLTLRGGIRDIGGGLSLQRVTDWEVRDVLVTRNDARLGTGGGVHISAGARVRFSSVDITSNRTLTGSGGGAGLNVQDGAIVQLTKTRVSDNESEASGGGVRVNSAQLILDGVRIDRNRAGTNGGGLALSGGAEVRASTSMIEENTVAAGRGGGVYGIGARVFFAGVTVRRNVAAQGAGGGLALLDGAEWRMTGGAISENRASTGSGGGAYVANTEARLDSVEVRSNGAFATGGAISSEALGYVVLDRVAFTLNTVNGTFGPEGGLGGAVSVRGNTIVNITRSVFSQNVSTGSGGAVHAANTAPISITDSRFEGNNAVANGGAIESRGDGTLTVLRAVIRDNSTTSGAGGGVALFGPFLIEQSTISSNRSTNSTGGGVYVSPGAPNPLSSRTIRNSTISGNSAGFGGGLAVGGPSPAGVVQVWHVSIVGNRAQHSSGGIGIMTAPGAVLINSLLAGNIGAQGAANCSQSTPPAPTSLGGNLSDDASCTGLITLTDRVNVPAGVALTLSDNGGSTLTHALLPGSMAINGGLLPHCVPTDQRGWQRIGLCDIGAFEFGASGTGARTVVRLPAGK